MSRSSDEFRMRVEKFAIQIYNPKNQLDKIHRRYGCDRGNDGPATDLTNPNDCYSAVNGKIPFSTVLLGDYLFFYTPLLRCLHD